MTRAAGAFLLVVALAVAFARAEEPALRPWTGATPALAGPTLDGRSLDLRALRGRVVLVEFWASWCEACDSQLPAVERLRAPYEGRPLEIVTVNLGEGPARVERFLREHGTALPVVLDRDRRIGAAWGVGGVPMTFLVDAAGRVRGSVFGACDFSAGELGAALERLVREAERRRPRRAVEARTASTR